MIWVWERPCRRGVRDGVFDGGEAERWICIRSQWKGDGEEKSIWQDEENDEEDEEEENKEKDETTTRNGTK